LACGFALGQKPTGNKDPYALRRLGLGLARTFIEGDVELPLEPLVHKAVSEVAALGHQHALVVDRDHNSPSRALRLGTAEIDAIVADLYVFILDRLRSYYADKGVPAAHFDAVADVRPASLPDFNSRLKAIGVFAGLPEAPALAAANKRIRNILKKTDDAIPDSVAPALLSEAAERELVAAVDKAIADTDPLLGKRDYVGVLTRLSQLRPQVDAFFDSVMVMTEDAAVRGNRLALLKRLADRFAAVAAVEQLSAS
jgi:glycyl-tRNA synthetase beta chain